MPEVTIDWVAIIVAVVAGMAIGALWYAPFLFGNTWMKLAGLTQEDIRAGGAQMGYLVAIFSGIVTSLIMTYVTQWAGAGGDFVEGMAVGAIVWLGFVVTAIMVTGVFQQRPWGLMMINSGQFLVTYMVTGGIVAAFA